MDKHEKSVDRDHALIISSLVSAWGMVIGLKKIYVMAVMLLIISMIPQATVCAATEALPAGVLICDQDGISASVTGEYFIDAPPLSAGDVITKRLTIHNTEPYACTITMTAEPLEETGPLRLLDEVHLNLRLDGTVLYNGRVRGDEGVNMIQNALKLGTYQTGDSRNLEITMTVNPDMETFYYHPSEAFFKWNFIAVRDTKPDEPKTGEIARYGLYAVTAGMLSTTVLLLILIGRQRRKERQPGM